MVIAATVIGASLSIVGSASAAQDGSAPISDPWANPSAHERMLGSRDAPVRLMLYTSFICPDCASWHKTVLPVIMARYIDTGRVSLIFRDLPTNPVELSLPSAAIARCARPERFLETASTLMDGQEAVLADGPATDWYDSAIAVSGRDRQEIEACVGDEETAGVLRAQAYEALKFGIERVPSLLLDGTLLNDISEEGLTTTIEAALESHDATSAPGFSPDSH